MRLSIKIGGHVLYEADGLVLGRLRSYAVVLKKLYWMGHGLSVVVGGGPPARWFIEAARKLGCPEAVCDELGIQVSRLNATLLVSLLGEAAYPAVPLSYAEAKPALSSERIVICGGFQPGQSTVAAAAVMAELMRADLLVVATDVDGVYTADPKKHPEAKKIPRLSYRDLEDLMARGEAEAGTFKLFDLVAVKILERARIPTVVVDGRDPAVLYKVIEGQDVGSRIEP
ncbi:MAG: UMP kinase [Thermoprotei archaeon]|nr:MAG: UMP kinase [Thermoprotei archaeon]